MGSRYEEIKLKKLVEQENSKGKMWLLQVPWGTVERTPQTRTLILPGMVGVGSSGAATEE